MIAPIREAPAPTRRSRRERRDVRHLVASLFLDEERPARRPVPSIAAWKAWLVTAWAVAITAAYFWAML